MNLKNYVDMIIKLKVEPRKSDFLCSIVEAFIRDPFTTEIVENPLWKYENNNTLRAICNGNKSLSKTCASELSNLYDKDKMTGRGRGKYTYKKEVRQEAEEYIRMLMKKHFPNNEIKYIV